MKKPITVRLLHRRARAGRSEATPPRPSSAASRSHSSPSSSPSRRSPRAEPRARGLLRPRRLRRPGRRARSRARRPARPTAGSSSRACTRRATTARRAAAAAGSSPPAARSRNIFRLDAPAAHDASPASSPPTERISPGAAAVGGADVGRRGGHGGAWEYIPPGARIHRRALRSTSAADRAGRDAHDADALRIGVRCDLRGPCLSGGQPAARFHALAVVLRDDQAPRVAITVPGGHVRGTIELPLGATDEGGGVFERTCRWTGTGSPAARSAGPCRRPSDRSATSSAGCHARSTPRRGSRSTRARSSTARTRCSRERRTSRATSARPKPRSSSTTSRRAPARWRSRAQAEVSEALTAEPNGFDGQDVAYSYRWQRCDAAGGGCSGDRRRGRSDLCAAAWRRRATASGLSSARPTAAARVRVASDRRASSSADRARARAVASPPRRRRPHRAAG